MAESKADIAALVEELRAQREDRTRLRNGWRVAKDIPVAMIAALVIQTLGVVWWAATLSYQVDALGKQVTTLAGSTVTTSDARGVDAVATMRNAEQDRRIQLLELQQRETAQQISELRLGKAK